MIGHPFGTLRVTLGRLTRRIGTDLADPAIERLVDSYLEPWRLDGWSQKSLLRQVNAAYRMAVLTRVYANIRGVDGLAAAVDPDERGDAMFWVQEMITDAVQPPRWHEGLPGMSARDA